MGLIREPKNVDLSTKSEPWTKQELADFRELMQKIKDRNKKRLTKTDTTNSSRKILA
jgi:hypothetical protein